MSLEETCFGQVKSCENTGTCVVETASLYVDNPQTACRCPNGYDGPRCENDLCLKLKCQNNGTCQRLPNGQAKCLCTEQWSGSECQDDIDECLNRTTILCYNNGICSNERGGYSCRCLENYLGSRCEREHVCLRHSPCLNQGLCKPHGEEYYCECSSSFTGT